MRVVACGCIFGVRASELSLDILPHGEMTTAWPYLSRTALPAAFVWSYLMLRRGISKLVTGNSEIFKNLEPSHPLAHTHIHTYVQPFPPSLPHTHIFQVPFKSDSKIGDVGLTKKVAKYTNFSVAETGWREFRHIFVLIKNMASEKKGK